MINANKLPCSHYALLAAIGAFCGVMGMLHLKGTLTPEAIAGKEHLLPLMTFGLPLAGAAVLLYLHRIARDIMRRLPLNEATRARFERLHIATYLVFLGSGFVASGIKFNFAFVFLLFLLFIAAQYVLLILIADRPQKTQWLTSQGAVPMLFFISGFAALIYQVVWQRVLFSTFGTNIESVTVIVSVFMFGLGVGALAGGKLQKYFPNRLLEAFVAVEIAIGAFGLVSIPLIHKIGEVVPSDSLIGLIAATYALLAIPTMLMGCTLPLLVAYLQKRFATLGATVGKLYAFNTFGSAFAAFVTVMLIFTIFGQQATVALAASCNVLTAALVWIVCRNLRGHAAAEPEPVAASADGLSPRTALLLSALVGYLSLSLEILWMRIMGFMTASLPQEFGMVLAIFLAGIGFGSVRAKKWSESGRDMRAFITRSLFIMAAVAYLSIPLVAFTAGYYKPVGQLIAHVAIFALAYFSGGIFPLLCQMGIRAPGGARTGEAVSWMYFLNIVGATSGSLITGFLMFEWFTLGQNATLIAAGVVLTLFVALKTRTPREWGLTAAALVAMVVLQPVLFANVIGRLQNYEGRTDLRFVHENRHGIITVFEDNEKGDPIFGNGAYDGRFNIDPLRNHNQITRVYLLAALHPNPKRVLEVGISGGAGTRVLTLYRPLEEVVGVEINPGYLDVLAHYPDIAPILTHKKLTPVIDDGRRWLRHHPDERFDAIVMNISFYWRSNATNILSREFLELCKAHLNPGGVIYYNTTGARDSIYTLAHVFKHVTVVNNFVAGSDRPFNLSYAQKKKNLLEFKDDKGAIFTRTDESKALLEEMANLELPDLHDSILAEPGLWLFTDDNMAPEYKKELSFLRPR